MKISQLTVSSKQEKREIEKCLSSSTEGHQFFFFEFKSALKGLVDHWMNTMLQERLGVLFQLEWSPPYPVNSTHHCRLCHGITPCFVGAAATPYH